MIKQFSKEFEMVETYLSWVFLGDKVVYKIKKPVKFQFIDFSTLEKRKFLCEEEVRLNSVLSPEIYLGVMPISKNEQGRYELEGKSLPIEYAVKMKRISDDKQLDNFIKAGKASGSHMERFAEAIYSFHQKARVIGVNEYDYVGILKKNIDNDKKLITEAAEEQVYKKEQLLSVFEALFSFLKKEHDLFCERQSSGKVRECHGDLRAGNVYWDEKPLFIDCIEFNKEFKYLDVMWEMAFLAMAIDACERRDLSDVLVKKYLELSKDPAPEGLINFHKCHMAIVLAKIQILKLKQKAGKKDELLRDFNIYLDMAEGYSKGFNKKLV